MNAKLQESMAIVLALAAMILPLRSSEVTTFNEGFGAGEHTRYSVDTWEGREFTISRLANKFGIFTLAKTAKSEYTIWLDREGGRIAVFCFNLTHASKSIDFHNPTYMVDVWMDGDEIALLVTDRRSYSYVRSTRKLPALEKGRHYFMTDLDDKSEWKLLMAMRGLEYDDPEESVTNDAYQSVRLIALDEIEFTYKNKTGEAPPKKKIKLSYGKIIMNGKELPFSRSNLHEVTSEDYIRRSLELLAPEDLTPEKIRKDFIRACGSKERAVAFFESFEDRVLADRLIKMVQEAFKEAKDDTSLPP